MIEILLFAAVLVGIIVLLTGISLMFLAIFNRFRFKRYILDEDFRPSISLIVPARNEANVIERTIKSFLSTEYPHEKKEMIIVNDASSDDTEKIVRKFASRIINEDEKGSNEEKNKTITENNILLINRAEGGRGKSFALNAGKFFAKGEILFFTDADIQLSKDVFLKAVRHLHEKNVGCVAGYVQVSGKKSFLNQFIDFEYVTGQKLLRRGFNVLGVHYIIPGGCAVFKRETLNKIGDYHNDTLAEDTDITWRVLTETKDKIHFDPSVKVEADEPSELASLWNQRIRWTRGNIEVTLKNKAKMFKPMYGRALTWVLPFWLSSMILPFAFILSASALLLAFVLNVQLSVPFLAKFLALTFFASWIAGSIMNKGRSVIGGLLSPGLPLLITLISTLIWDNGLGGLLGLIGFSQSNTIAQLIIGTWVLVAIPGTYLCLFISRRYPKIGVAIQLLAIGYWMFLLTTVFEGYRRELLNKKKEWVRTER